MWGQGGLDWKVGRKCLQDRESSCPEELRPSKGRKGQQLSWFSLMMRNMVALLGETRKAQGQEEHPKTQLMPVLTLLCNKCACSERQLLSARDFNLK